MRILYDHQIYSLQRWGGISRYHTSLIQYLSREQDVEVMVSVRYSNNELLRSLKGEDSGNHSDYFGLETITGGLSDKIRKNRILREIYKRFKGSRGKVGTPFTRPPAPFSINQKFSVFLLEKGDFDIFHPTYYHPYFLPYLKNKPFVITIHDMIHEVYPEFFGPDPYITAWKRELALRANKIIAVSENTKKDILRFYDVSPDKISVIRHGYDDSLKIKMNTVYGKSSLAPYILFVGKRDLYKNFYFFVMAVSKLLIDREIKLICVGGGKFSSLERHFLSSFGLSKLVKHVEATEEELRHLYENALCFVFPSIYEGFGLPILEAFGNGCATALSNIGVFKEVAGDAALYFEPKDRHSICDAISMISEDETLRRSLIERGKKRVRTYTWEVAAQKTLDVYRSLLTK